MAPNTTSGSPDSGSEAVKEGDATVSEAQKDDEEESKQEPNGSSEAATVTSLT